MKQRTTDAIEQASSVDLTGPTVAAVRGGPPPTPPAVSVTAGSAPERAAVGSTSPRPPAAPPRGRASRGRSSGGRSAMTTAAPTAAPTQDIGSTVTRLVASAPPLSEAQRTRLRMLLTGSSGS